MIALGADIRNEFADDSALANVLRCLLPRYAGCGRELYRAAFAANVLSETWGLSWSWSLRVAREFASGPRRNAPRGSVIISAHLPRQSIIAKVPRSIDLASLREFVVDPQLLERVRVIKLHQILN